MGSVTKITNDVMDILAKEIQKEIDAEIMFNVLKDSGWYPVADCKNLSFNKPLLYEVERWLTTMCQGKYHIKSHTDYIFERQDDAMMFSLKWQ